MSATFFSTEDWMRLFVSALMMLCGLLALLAPLRSLRLPQRPWFLILTMLLLGFFGVLGPLAQGFRWGLWLEVVGVAGQGLTIIALLSAFIWMRRRAKRQQSSSSEYAWLNDTDGLGEIRALLSAGQQIEAIRRLRERTGLGLAEAKRTVENL